jgi:Ni/Co efflux regulator RcnB
MSKRHLLSLGLAFAVAGALASATAFGDKPSWAGNGNQGRGADESSGHGHEYEHQRDESSYHGARNEEHREHRFDERHREAVRDYYAREFHHGHCPHGLAKKHDGCVPPGHARRWEVGERLPTDVRRYSLPHSLTVEIGVPPPGYQYVRVASDVLMIATGTGMIVDAIDDLGRK